MPPETHTRLRNIRVEDELWNKAKARAAERGESLSEAIRRFLIDYTAPERKK